MSENIEVVEIAEIIVKWSIPQNIGFLAKKVTGGGGKSAPPFLRRKSDNHIFFKKVSFSKGFTAEFW